SRPSWRIWIANALVQVANLLQARRGREDLKLENVGRRGSARRRRENGQSGITSRSRRNVMRGDALDIARDTRDRSEIDAIHAHLNIEIARIQVEVVPSGARMFHDESSDARILAKVHFEKSIDC